MTQQAKNSLLAAAILAGLLSLPATWMTITASQLRGPAGGLLSVFDGLRVNVTGLNGSLTLLIAMPIWLIVGIAIGSSALQLAKDSKTFAVPPALQWGTAIVAVAWIIVPLTIGMLSKGASPGIGALLGLFAAGAPLVTLRLPTTPSANSSIPPYDPSSEE